MIILAGGLGVTGVALPRLPWPPESRILLLLLLLLGSGVAETSLAVASAQRTPALDFDALAAAGNTDPIGLWGNTQTLWVADNGDAKLYAYDQASRQRAAERDIDVEAVGAPTGLWSDGTTIWVLSYWGGAFAYDLASGAPVSSLNRSGVGVLGNRGGAMGLWSDGETAWVAHTSGTVAAYAWSSGQRQPDKDFTTLADAGAGDVQGLWSDGDVLWLADVADDKLYAYGLHTRARLAARDFNNLAEAGNRHPQGVWSDGETLWLADWREDKLYAYSITLPLLESLQLSDVDFASFHRYRRAYRVVVPRTTASTTVTVRPAAESATVAITPADADDATPGHQVSLAAGTTTITVMVTLADGTTKGSYTVEITRSQLGRLGRPNVVLILADDLGYGDVRAMNPISTLPTPRIDSLAADGMRFTDAHSPASVCIPTRYGLLTGRYAWRVGSTRGRSGYAWPLIEPDRPTLGTLLQASGYRTAAIGKWHLGMRMPYHDPASDQPNPSRSGDPGIDFGGVISNGPIQRGFDEFFGLSTSLQSPPYAYIRNDRFTSSEVASVSGRGFPRTHRPGPQAEDFVFDQVMDRLTEEAVAFIEGTAGDTSPFFLYLPLSSPHLPIWPAERFRGATDLGPYGDFVAQIDWAVGQVLDALDRIGARDNTLVIFTSDNGSYMGTGSARNDHSRDSSKRFFESHQSNGPWRGRKHEIYEGGHRVPFLVRWPATVEAGASTAATFTFTDLYATLADIVGAPPAPGVAPDSVSLLPLLRGEPWSRGVPVIHEAANTTLAIRDGAWKLVLSNGSGGIEAMIGRPCEEPWQLYNLSQEALEISNLVDSHPEVVERLKAAFVRILISEGSIPDSNCEAATFTVSAVPSAIAEGDSSTLTVELGADVTLPEDQTFTLAVEGSASATDYELSPQTLTLVSGASSVTATLAASVDQEEEPDETVTVTASRDGSPIGSATVTIRSLSQDARLSSLSLSGIDIGTFSAATAAYTASVAHATTSTTVTATPSHGGALVSIDPGPEVPLAEGANEIAVTVTAQDGKTTQTYTVTVTRASVPLTASWASLPESHSGWGTVVLQVLFSEPVATSYATLRDESFQMTNGQVRQARRVNGRNDLWEIHIQPSADADLVVMLPATTDCEAAGAVCTEGGKALSAPLEATVPWVEVDLPVVSVVAVEERVTGPIGAYTLSRTGPTTEPLEVQLLMTDSSSGNEKTLSFEIPSGSSTVTKQVQAGDNQLVEDDITVTWTLQAGAGYTVSAEQASAAVVLEESDVPEFAVTVEPAEIAEGESATVRVESTNGVSFRHDQTIALSVSGTASEADYTGLPATLTLAAYQTAVTAALAAVADGTAEEAETVALAASHGGEEIGSATLMIAASAATPLTARFVEMPTKHDGETAFTFELRFSEEIDISYVTLRDTAFEVTGGTVRGARRLERPANLRWEITVEPASNADVVLALPATTDCLAAGAVCTAGGKALSQRLAATVEGPGSEPSGQGFSLALENSRPSGIWSDGETAWVADLDDARLYAYRRSDGEREPEKDIATGPAPMGLWSDGQTLWAAGLGGGLRAHRLADGSRLPGRDLALEANSAPAGVWSDGETLWAADWLGARVHAYRLSDGRREAARDIQLTGGNLMPVGVWSDGETLWVADWRERAFAYRLSNGAPDRRRDIKAGTGDTDPTGLWSSGGTLLATGWESGEVRAYRFPEAAAVEDTPGKKPAVGLTARAASLPPVADPALQAAIAAALGKASGDAVSLQELAGLEALTARDAGIRDLSGLEQAVSLKELDLGFNPLPDLRPLAALPALESLNLDGAVPDLQPLASLVRLQRLSLRNNGIDDLWPLAGLTSLAELDLGDNRITDLQPLAGLGKVSVLRADRNLIADLWALASLADLEALDLRANRVQDLRPLAGLAGLRSLRLGGNGLAELHPLSGLGALRDLGLAGNAVEDLAALSQLDGLRRLDLRGNPAGDLRPLRALASLAWIHVGGSRIEDLAPLDGLPGLTVAGRDDREPPSVDGSKHFGRYSDRESRSPAVDR